MLSPASLLTKPAAFSAEIVARSQPVSGRVRQQNWYARRRKSLQQVLVVNAASHCLNTHEARVMIADRAGVELDSGDLKATRRAVNASVRQLPIAHKGAVSRYPLVVERPTGILGEAHRPAILPGLVDPAPPPRILVPLNTILQQLDVRIAAGEHPYRTLDWLQSTSGLGWDRCAEILRVRGIAIDHDAVVMLAAARGFWDRLCTFRHIYANAVLLDHVEPAEGDWALIEADELSEWLQGLQVPRMHRREAYLMRVVSRGGPLLALDFHGFPSYLPLFTVPV